MSIKDITLDINKENSEVILELFTDLESNPVKIVFENNEFQIKEGE